MASASTTSARLKFWGVRGSIPVPGPDTLRYGGNTTCVEIRADDEIIICDAGTGIRSLGYALEQEFGSNPIRISLLITHMHWDHIQGFPFFLPSYNDKNLVRIFGYDGADAGLRDILVGQMATPFFPVKLNDLPGRIVIKKLDKYEFSVGKVQVKSKVVNHPGVCVGYRIETSAGTIVFIPDNEPYETKLHATKHHLLSPEQVHTRAAEARAGLVQFLRGADLLILDAQYTDDEYQAHIGWGHGSLSSAVGIAAEAGVPRLVLFHHDPAHNDEKIDAMAEEAQKIAARTGKQLTVDPAREGVEITVGAPLGEPASP